MKTIKAKVHRLPTLDRTHFQYLNHKKHFRFFKEIPRLLPSDLRCKFHHLYITTDEEIKEGDWFINTGSGGHPTPKVYQANSENSKAFKEFGPYPEIRKIIATTDPKLIISISKSMNKDKFPDITLPKIPQSFIEAYCKAGGIDEVLVEYIDVMPQLNGTRTDGKIIDEISLEPSLNTLSVPKLNPDNTIIIHPVEEKMYSEAEIKQNLEKLFCDLAVEFGFTPQLSVLEKWIEENL